MRSIPSAMWRGVPLLLIPLGIYSQQFYVLMSKGTGAGHSEIPFASGSKLIEDLKLIDKTVTTPVVVSDSPNASLFKFEGAYLQGRRLLIPAVKFFPVMIPSRGLYVKRQFDWMDGTSQSELNGFDEDQTMEQSVARDGNVTVLLSTNLQTVLNRSSSSETANHIIVPMKWRSIRNRLIFIHSNRGHSMVTHNRRLTSFFPVYLDGLKNSSVSGVGRYLLFRVVNPTSRFRLVLHLSSLDHELPPVSAIGKTRIPVKFTGSGSGRIVSEPMEPQLVNGVPYIGLDMGMDPVQVHEIRSGLMRMWHTTLPLEYRMLVGLARNISIITEEEYRGFHSPGGIEKIPDDFLNNQLEYSGIAEDGWLSTDSYFLLSSGESLQPLTIRGLVPITNDPSFSTTMTVSVDGEEVGKRTLGIGEFEYLFPVAQRAGQRRVAVQFSKSQRMLYNDTRQASALLRCISFQSKACQGQSDEDIVKSGNGVWRGDNWYPLERENANRFRWVRNDAEILLSPRGNESELAIDIEPGPSLQGRPLQLEVQDSEGRLLARKDVNGREIVKVALPPSSGTAARLSTVRFHSRNGGGAIAGEQRILNFRIFRAALQASAAKPQAVSNDIAASDDVIQLGANWYPLETFGGERFRWVNNDAVLTITDPKVLAKGITMEIEPGPGVPKRPLVLRVLDSTGRQVQALEIASRQTITLLPPATVGKPAEYRLHIDGGGTKIPSDSRILNFRVLKIQTSAHASTGAADITDGGGLRLGKGWYPLENFTDGTFRWVDNDAQFTLDGAQTHLELEIQPGPGMDARKMVLKVLDASGRQVQSVEVNGRQVVKLLLPATRAKEAAYRLHVDGGGKKIATDPRILNFRVFRMKASL